MTALGIGIVSLAMMVVLIIAGLHVAISLLLLSFVGVWLMRDNIDVALALMAQATGLPQVSSLRSRPDSENTFSNISTERAITWRTAGLASAAKQ